MADKKISELAPLSNINGEEQIPVAFNGGNNSVTLQKIKDYTLGDYSTELDGIAASLARLETEIESTNTAIAGINTKINSIETEIIEIKTT